MTAIVGIGLTKVWISSGEKLIPVNLAVNHSGVSIFSLSHDQGGKSESVKNLNQLFHQSFERGSGKYLIVVIQL